MKANHKIIVFVVVTLVLVASMFMKKDSDADLEKKADEISRENIKRLKDQKLKNTAPPTKAPAYKRKPLKKPIFASDMALISSNLKNNDDLEKFSKMIRGRSESQNSDFPQLSKPEWDLSQLPATDEEYHQMTNEMQIQALHYMVDNALQDNYAAVRIGYGAYVGAALMDSFTFKGYDENDQWVLEVPPGGVAKVQEQYEKVAAKFRSQNSRARRVANKGQNQKQAAANAAEEKAPGLVEKSEEKFSLQAIFTDSAEQATYFADLEDPDKVSKRYFKNKDSFFESLRGMLDYIISTISTFDIFNLEPEKIHNDNIRMINEILDEAKVKPSLYGLTNNPNGENKFDVTDLDFEVLAEALARDVGVWHAIVGAGLSTVMGQFVIDKIQSARIFAVGVLATIGVESVISAVGCYWGTKKMVMLHRYHTHMRRAKEYYKETKQDFGVTLKKRFDPNKVYYSEAMRITINKSWLWGFGFGSFFSRLIDGSIAKVASPVTSRVFGISTVIGIKAVEWLASGSRIAQKLAFNSAGKLAAKGIGSKGGVLGSYLVFELFKSDLSNFLTKILALPNPALKWAGKLTGAAKRIIPPGVGAAASILAEFTFTSFAIYTTIHTRLFANSIMLDRLYYAPEMAIHLSQLDSWHEEEPFIDATRRLFYPVCFMFATTDLNSQKMTRFAENDEDSAIVKMFSRQKQNCIRIVAAFEGIETDKVQEHLESLAADGKLDTTVPHLYFGKGEVSQFRGRKYLAEMFVQYPEFYRIIWVAGLKSIFEYDNLPNGFYGLKNLIVNGTGYENYEDFFNYWDMSTHKSAEQINILRYEYIMEKVAHKAKELKVEAGLAKESDPLDITEAFVIFWKNHSAKSKGISKEVLELLKKEEKSFWYLVWDGFKASYNNLAWSFNRWRASPYSLTFRHQVETEIQSMVEANAQPAQ